MQDNREWRCFSFYTFYFSLFLSHQNFGNKEKDKRGKRILIFEGFRVNVPIRKILVLIGFGAGETCNFTRLKHQITWVHMHQRCTEYPYLRELLFTKAQRFMKICRNVGFAATSSNQTRRFGHKSGTMISNTSLNGVDPLIAKRLTIYAI